MSLETENSSEFTTVVNRSRRKHRKKPKQSDGSSVVLYGISPQFGTLWSDDDCEFMRLVCIQQFICYARGIFWNKFGTVYLINTGKVERGNNFSWESFYAHIIDKKLLIGFSKNELHSLYEGTPILWSIDDKVDESSIENFEFAISMEKDNKEKCNYAKIFNYITA